MCAVLHIRIKKRNKEEEEAKERRERERERLERQCYASLAIFLNNNNKQNNKDFSKHSNFSKIFQTIKFLSF
jgi:hypothetical protein